MKNTALAKALAPIALAMQQEDAAKAARLRKARSLPKPAVGPRIAR